MSGCLSEAQCKFFACNPADDCHSSISWFVKIRMRPPFWYWSTQVVVIKRSLNGCLVCYATSLKTVASFWHFYHCNKGNIVWYWLSFPLLPSCLCFYPYFHCRDNEMAAITWYLIASGTPLGLGLDSPWKYYWGGSFAKLLVYVYRISGFQNSPGDASAAKWRKFWTVMVDSFLCISYNSRKSKSIS